MNNLYFNNVRLRQQVRRFRSNSAFNRLWVINFFKQRFSRGALAVMTCVLSGCMATAVVPATDRGSAIRNVLVVPVEAPPLEVIPDNIKNRMPVYGQYVFETVPSALLMSEKIYRSPGGILIAGMVGIGDSVKEAELQPASGGAALEPGAALKDDWVSTLVLAEHAASTLNTGRVRAALSGHFLRLPIADEDRTANLGNWRGAVKEWYAQNQSSVDYRQAGVEPVDAVLEIGVGSYRIFGGQTSLQVLLKLIDPGTGRVISRTRVQDISVEDDALALLGHEGEYFKSVVTRMGVQLLTGGLNDLGLAQDMRSGSNKPEQTPAENREG